MLEIKNATKRFGDFVAVNGVSMSIPRGTTHAVIGPNGAGKTTLFNLASGSVLVDEGTVEFEGRKIERMAAHDIVKIGMARSFQKVNIFPRKSLLENVQVPLIVGSRLHFNPFREAADVFNDEAMELLELVGLADTPGRRAGELAHGRQKQLELAITLASKPKMLLLDEPTAGMSIAETKMSIRLINEIVQKRNLTLLFTEHDMGVVFDIASAITVLHHGQVIAHGAPHDVRANEEVKRVYLGKH